MDSCKSNQQSPDTKLPVVEVVAAIIIDNNHILATQRGYGKWRGWWEFPGGKIQQGESREKALIREIKEELDAEIVIDRFHATVNYNYPEFHLTMHCYLCHFHNGNFTLKEHLSARWLSADSLRTVQWPPADLNLVSELSQLIQSEKK